MPDLDLPRASQNAILAEFPETGAAYLANWQVLIAELLAQWALTPTGVATGGLDINRVIFVTDASGRQCVLKVGHPHPEQLTEMLALQHYHSNQNQVVRLLKWDEARGAILLERLLPGTTLREMKAGDTGLAEALQLHRELPALVPNPSGLALPTYSAWLQRAFEAFVSTDQSRSHFAALQPMVNRASESFLQLGKRYAGNFLLHGDLHHENILFDDQRGWVAIDPKGVLGLRPLEAGRLLHNFMADDAGENASVEQIKKVLRNRYLIASEVLNIPWQDVALVTQIDVTLCTCWTFNSGEDIGGKLALLEAAFELSTPALTRR